MPNYKQVMSLKICGCERRKPLMFRYICGTFIMEKYPAHLRTYGAWPFCIVCTLDFELQA